MRRRSSRSNRHGTPRMRLPMSLPAPGIFSTASKNFFGMKWVYASMRMGGPPDRVGAAADGCDPAAGCGGLGGKGHGRGSAVKAHAAAVALPRSLRRNAQAQSAFDTGEAAPERLAFGIEQGGG